VDDAHGYGQASRFLTEAVQALFDSTTTESRAWPTTADPDPRRRPIEVSVDALFT
jgi:hypothetical protein